MVKLPRAKAAGVKKSFRGNRPQSLSDESNGETDEIIIPLAPLPPEKKALSEDELFAAAGVVILGVPHFLQEEFSWCYAACGRMILRAFQRNVPQCRIVARVKGIRGCCNDPTPLACVDGGAFHRDIAPIYTDEGVTAIRHQPHGPISINVLRNNLQARRPVEITRQYKEQPNSFHAVVIKGFKDNMFLIHDPLKRPTGNPYSYVIKYPKLRDGRHFTWDETWRFPPIPQ